MDLESVDIAALSTSMAMQRVAETAQVKVAKGVNDQLEQVMGKLLEGIAAAAPRAPEQTGQSLNIVA